jgi:glycerophosphoryl diester phosphodiesterase
MKIFGHGTQEPDNLINSRASFRALADAGFHGVELDVRRTADDGLAVIHDAAYGDGRPVDETLLEDRPESVATLAEALDLCAGMVVNIELKNYVGDPAFDPGELIADLTLEFLHRRRNDTVIVSPFGLGCIDRVREADASIDTAHLVLSRRPAVDVVRPLADHGHRIVHPYVSMVDEAFMGAARSAGLMVNVWTGFDETGEDVERMAALGVDGLITAQPERARTIVDEHS